MPPFSNYSVSGLCPDLRSVRERFRISAVPSCVLPTIVVWRHGGSKRPCIVRRGFCKAAGDTIDVPGNEQGNAASDDRSCVLAVEAAGGACCSLATSVTNPSAEWILRRYGRTFRP